MPNERQDLSDALMELWKHYPQWRFGQLVSNVATWAGDNVPGEIGDVSDQELLNAAREHLEKLQSGGPRRAAV
ncbi:MAG: hypothetical protein JWN40_3498 [Phycisphaerales bacterium]|nr:hypothetical protein [Phycisphaerales bacterium]